MKKLLASLVFTAAFVGGACAAETVQQSAPVVEEIVPVQSFAEYVETVRLAPVNSAIVSELNVRFAQLAEAEKEAAVELVVKTFAGKVAFDKEASVFVLVVKTAITKPGVVIPAVIAAVIA